MHAGRQYKDPVFIEVVRLAGAYDFIEVRWGYDRGMEKLIGFSYDYKWNPTTSYSL